MRYPLSPLLTRSAAAAALSLGIITSASGAFAAGAHATTRSHAKATTVQGTVVSENHARHTLVVVLRSGALRTLRFSTSRRVALGAQISSRATKLGDGTLRATSLSVHAKSHSVRVHATVIATHGRRLELSGGGSSFAVTRTGVSSHSSTSTPVAGEIVNVTVDFQNGSLDETSIQDVGTTSMIGLEGVLASISSTSLTINVDEGATTTVAIPTSITLPSTIAAGDQVELLVAYANQAFSLVTIVDDQSAATNSSTGVTESDQNQNSAIEVEGIVVAADATSLTIQPGDNAAPITVAVPSTLTLAPVVIGDRVHAVADMVATTLTLVSLDVQAPEGDQGQTLTTEAEGQVVAVSATSLVVQPNDQASPVSFTVPASVDVSSIVVGDQVHASGTLDGGVLTLTEFEVQGQDGSQNGDNTTEVDGVVTAVSPTSLTVLPGDQGAAVTIAVPSTVDVSSIAVGEKIHTSDSIMSGTLTLVSFEGQ